MTLSIAQARLPLADPHDCTDVGDALSMLGAVYEPLVRREGTGFAPAIAASWSVSEDARRWCFTLHPGRRFHDGTRVDAAAVVASLERMARPDMGATLGAPAVWAQYLGGAVIVAEAADRVSITLAAPMADLLDVLCYAHVIAPDHLEAPLQGASGTGPWQWGSRGDGWLEMQAVSGHRAAPTDDVHWQLIADPAARLEALASGAVAVANDLPWAAAAPAGTTLVAYADPMAVIFLFNPARPALADPRIRRALNLAVDRAALVDTVRHGAAAPLHGFVSPAHAGHVPTPDGASRAVEARRLLHEAGVGDGLHLTVETPTSLPAEAEALTAAVAVQLAPFGIEMTVQRWTDRERYAHRIRRSEVADMAVFDSSPMSTFRVLHEKIDSRVQGSWWLGYRNTEVEALIDRARVETDTAKRHALFQACYRLMQEDPPWLTCYCQRKRIGLRGDYPAWRMRSDGVLDVRGLPELVG